MSKSAPPAFLSLYLFIDVFSFFLEEKNSVMTFRRKSNQSSFLSLLFASFFSAAVANLSWLKNE
jgi:hypothetical protein